MRAQKYIKESIRKALEQSGFDSNDDKLLLLEKPKQDENGDLSSPVAMTLARVAHQAPRRIAEGLVKHLTPDPDFIEKIEIAGPGFINFFLSNGYLQRAVLDIIASGDTYGTSDWGKREKVQFEFVSANPTGPLNIVSARAAALGDVLANLWAAVGYDTEREYYVNDAGRQVRLLGASLSARYMAELGQEEKIPEDGYHGHYLIDIAQLIISREGDRYSHMDKEERQKLLTEKALNCIIARQKESLANYRLHYDNWFLESDLRKKMAHRSVLQKLTGAGYIFEQDGATWFRSSEFGDEKDRVLITGDGEPTYFLIDIAYHDDKYNRGFSQVHDLWGPDHHGYIDRMTAALTALGHTGKSFHVHIIQQVNLLRGGEVVKMSKRAGEIIEMDELIEEVGVDAARYFFVDRRLSQPLDFDIDLAKKQSDENPVYYVQYAHARICNVLRFAVENGVKLPDPGAAHTDILVHERELDVIKKLTDYPEVISRAVVLLEPHRLTNYLHELATVFHRFYHDHRVVTEEKETTDGRLALVQATRIVLANGLKLLGISAPENM